MRFPVLCVCHPRTYNCVRNLPHCSRSLIGYVDIISNIRTIKSKESNRSFEFFKFVINNNEGSRISCCAFSTDATAVSAKIKLNQEYTKSIQCTAQRILELNELSCYGRIFFKSYSVRLIVRMVIHTQILLVENATATQSSAYNEGNAAFELQMKHFTEITDLGTYDISQIYGNIERIDLDQASEKIGHISTYSCTVKQYSFYIISHQNCRYIFRNRRVHTGSICYGQ